MECDDEIEKWSSFDMRGKLDGLPKLLEIAENNHDVVADWASFILTLSGSTTSSNPRLIEGCLEILSAVFKSGGCSATSFSKLLLPAITAGFTHIKATVNLAAIDLVMSVAVASSQEKSLASSFIPQLFSLLNHDLWRVRAQTLQSLLKLCEQDNVFEDGESPIAVIVSRESVTKLAACLDDAHATVRQHAMSLTSFIVSSSEKRNKVLSSLQAFGVRSTHMVTLRRMVGDMKTNGASVDKENVSKSVNTTSRPSSIKSYSMSKKASASASSGSGIKPIVVDSDSEMNREMSKIEKDLHNEDDWKKREKALLRLQALATGSSDRESFTTGLRSIADLVAAQVRDLRSALSKEGCSTVGVLAQLMRDSFAPFADIFIAPLISLTIQAIAVIAESGMSGLQDIVTATTVGFPSFLKKLNLVSSKKKGQDRAPALSLTALAIRTWTEPSHKVSKVFSDLEPLLKERLKDHDKDVRSSARLVMCELELVLPEVGQRLFARLDVPSQKEFLVLRSKRGGDAVSEPSQVKVPEKVSKVKVSSSVDDSEQTKTSTHRALHLGAATRTALTTESNVSTDSFSSFNSSDSSFSASLKKPSRRMSLSSGPTRVCVPMKAYGGETHKKSGRRMSMGMPARMSDTVQLTSSRRTVEALPSRMIQETVVAEETAQKEEVQEEAEVAEEKEEDHSATDLLSQELMMEPEEQAVTSHEDSPPLPPSLNCMTTSPLSPLLPKTKQPDLFSPNSPQAPTLSSPITQSPLTFSSPTVLPPAAANEPLTPVAPHVLHLSPTAPSPTPPSPVAPLIVEQVDTTPRLLQEACDIGNSKFKGTWADRLKFAQSLGPSLIRQFSDLTANDKVCVRSALHILLGDLHEKVMVTTLTVLVVEFERQSEETLSEPLIEVALPRAAHLLFDKKENIRSLAQRLLDCIRGHTDASFVLKLCMSQLSEGVPDKARHVLIDFATPIIPLAALRGSFNNSKCFLLKNTVTRLSVVAVLGEVSNCGERAGAGGSCGPTAARDRCQLKDAAVRALGQLCKAVDPVLVVSQIKATVALEQQQVLRPLLALMCPGVSEAWTLAPLTTSHTVKSPAPLTRLPTPQPSPVQPSAVPQQKPQPSHPSQPSRATEMPVQVMASESGSDESEDEVEVSRLLDLMCMSEDACSRTQATLSLNDMLKWKRMPLLCFSSVLVSLLDGVTHSPILITGEMEVDDVVAVNASLFTLKTLVTHYTACFRGSIQVVTRKLMSVLPLPIDLAMNVEGVLTTLMVNTAVLKMRGHGVDAVCCVRVLLPHLQRPNTSKSAASVLRPLIPRVPSADLLTLLQDGALLQALQQALVSESCDVRKASVLVLADVCLSLGDVAFPILSSTLSPHHMKLITLYANKQKTPSE